MPYYTYVELASMKREAYEKGYEEGYEEGVKKIETEKKTKKGGKSRDQTNTVP